MVAFLPSMVPCRAWASEEYIGEVGSTPLLNKARARSVPANLIVTQRIGKLVIKSKAVIIWLI